MYFKSSYNWHVTCKFKVYVLIDSIHSYIALSVFLSYKD